MWMWAAAASSSCIDQVVEANGWDEWETYTFEGVVEVDGQSLPFTQAANGDFLRTEFDHPQGQQVVLQTPTGKMERHPDGTITRSSEPAYMADRLVPWFENIKVIATPDCQLLQVDDVEYHFDADLKMVEIRDLDPCRSAPMVRRFTGFRPNGFPTGLVSQEGDHDPFTLRVNTVGRTAESSAFSPLEGPSSDAPWEGPSVSMPYKLRGMQPFVEVTITGSEGEQRGWMMVDTGAQLVSLTPSAAKTIGLESMKVGGVRGLAGEVAGRLGILPKLQAGDWTSENVAVTVLPHDGSIKGRPVFGVIGMPLLGDKVIHFNPIKRRLTLQSPKTFQSSKPFVPLETLCNDPVVDMKIGPYDGKWKLDTGASVTIRLGSEDSTRQAQRQLGGTRQQMLGAGDQTIDAWLTRVPTATLGGHEVTEPNLLLLPRTHDTHSTLGNVGQQLLVCFEQTYDFHNGRAYFEPAFDLDTCAAPPRFAWWVNALTVLCCASPFLGMGLTFLAWVRRRRRSQALLDEIH